VFGVVHPLLLWGTAAVAVPVLIHLLLRQRPRPRPWAAMQWLLAAIQSAQRRYKLTNFLLLLLRCLAVLLAALAVSRPNLAGLGQGGQLVVVIDCTASMGERGGDPGPLANAKAQLAKADLPAHVVVVTVAERVRVIANGTRDEAQAAIERLAAEPIPGGLNRAASADGADVLLVACPASADVLLASDFQQDDADLLVALLTPKVRSVTRWAIGTAVANTVIAGIDTLPDPQPGQPGGPDRDGAAAGRNLRGAQLLGRQGAAGAAHQGGHPPWRRGLPGCDQPVCRLQQPCRQHPQL